MSDVKKPKGECLCGCGGKTSKRSSWVQGHDRKAEAAVIWKEYGDIAQFLAKHGYGFGGKSAFAVWNEKNNQKQ